MKTTVVPAQVFRVLFAEIGWRFHRGCLGLLPPAGLAELGWLIALTLAGWRFGERSRAVTIYHQIDKMSFW
jgi:hypothetical protein